MNKAARSGKSPTFWGAQGLEYGNAFISMVYDFGQAVLKIDLGVARREVLHIWVKMDGGGYDCVKEAEFVGRYTELRNLLVRQFQRLTWFIMPIMTILMIVRQIWWLCHEANILDYITWENLIHASTPNVNLLNRRFIGASVYGSVDGLNRKLPITYTCTRQWLARFYVNTKALSTSELRTPLLPGYEY